jgi:hypothetical protein
MLFVGRGRLTTEDGVVMDCITIRLTDQQREAIREATGKEVKALSIATEELDYRAVDPDELPNVNDDQLIWECLNPYP